MVTDGQILVMVCVVGAWCVGILTMAAALTFHDRRK